MYLYGDKNKLAIIIKIENIVSAKGIIWGGFEIWINGDRFGNIDESNFISGNNYSMISKLQERNISSTDLFSLKSEDQIFDTIYNNFTGNTVDLSRLSLQQAADHDRFWGQFVLSPNGTMEFDGEYIFYLKEQNFLKFIYRRYNAFDIQHLSLPVDYIDKISIECITFLNGLLSPHGL